MSPDDSPSPTSAPDAPDAASASDPRGDDSPDDSAASESVLASSPWSRRLGPYVVGVLLVTMPALTLVAAYAVLAATRSALLEGLTPVEVVELYLVELAMFAVFGYLLYRLVLFGVRRQLLAEAEAEADADADADVTARAPGGSASADESTESEPVESKPREVG
jgi:hypothetical protein